MQFIVQCTCGICSLLCSALVVYVVYYAVHKVGYAVYCAVQKVRYVVFHDVMLDRIRNSRENKSESKNKKCPPKVNNNAF